MRLSAMLHKIQDAVISVSGSVAKDPDIAFVYMADGQKYAPNAAYLISEEDFDSFLMRAKIDSCAVFFVYGASVQTAKEIGQASGIVVFFNLPIVELHNQLVHILQDYAHWCSQIEDALFGSNDMEYYLEIVADRLQCPLLLIDTSLRTIAKTRDISSEESLLTASVARGFTPPDAPFDANQDLKTYKTLQCGERTALFVPLYYEQRVGGYMVVFPGANKSPEITNGYLCDARKLLQNYFDRGGHQFFEEASIMDTLIRDLLENRISDPGEINLRLNEVGLNANEYLRILLISFEDNATHIMHERVRCHINSLFTKKRISQYNGDMVVLLAQQAASNTSKKTEDTITLEKILEENHAYAAISYGTIHPRSLRPLYLQAAATLRIGRTMQRGKKRIFRYEDFALYYIIELCSEVYRNDYHVNNLLYLCDPAVTRLLRYDKEHHSDLARALKVYLEEERNCTSAAKRLYIHRNTMISRIERIQELIGQNLENYELRQRILFTYHVIDYVEHCLNEDIFDLKW